MAEGEQRRRSILPRRGEPTSQGIGASRSLGVGLERFREALGKLKPRREPHEGEPPQVAEPVEDRIAIIEVKHEGAAGASRGRGRETGLIEDEA
jgi:hypothetical protein